jgi:protein O-mannosyl-transferase
MARQSPRALPIFCLIAVTWLVFGPVVRANFVFWDDPDLVYTNPGLSPPSLAHVAEFWSRPYQKLYTPMAYTTWSLVAALEDVQPDQQLRPGPFHLLNLLLHTTAAVLVFLLLAELSGSVWPAWVGAMLFALHPLQVEPVAWVSGMNNLLCGVFSVAALWQYVLYARRGAAWRLSVATLLYAAALLSKPTAVVLPLLTVALDLGILRRPFLKTAAPFCLWLVMAVPIGLIAHFAQPPSGSQLPWYSHVIVPVDAIGFYSAKLLAPVHLGIDYERTPRWLMQHPSAAWRGLFVLLLATIVLRRSLATLRVPLAMSVLALLPVLGLVPFDFQSTSTVADRYMYLPMIGIALALALALSPSPGVPGEEIGRMTAANPANRALVLCVLCALALRSFAQMRVWRNTGLLAADEFKIDPDNSTGHKILAEWLSTSGRNDEAEREFLRAIACLQAEGKTMDATWFDYANLLRRENRLNEAIVEYKEAIPRLSTNAQRAEAYDNLGVAYAQSGDFTAAREQFQMALKLRPDYADAIDNLRRVGG